MSLAMMWTWTEAGSQRVETLDANRIAEARARENFQQCLSTGKQQKPQKRQYILPNGLLTPLRMTLP